MNTSKLPFYWFGYVITDTRSNPGHGFWSPFPRFVSNLGHVTGMPWHWDYWSVREEITHRTVQRRNKCFADQGR